jgi:uncharacterized protein YodC (DUF2158 family)
MNMSIFRTGDIVTLISGSVDMTVEKYETNELGPTENVCCIWFNFKHYKAEMGIFHEDMLVLAKHKKPRWDKLFKKFKKY